MVVSLIKIEAFEDRTKATNVVDELKDDNDDEIGHCPTSRNL